MKRCGLVLAAAMLMMVPSVFGQGPGSDAGRYATHNISVDSTELPGGGHVDILHYHQVVFADDPASPLDGTSGDCVGMTMFAGSGAVTTASGSCYIKDAAGNGVSMWWRMDTAGTADCPMMCGSWGYFDGYGKFKGITGQGTWKQVNMFADGHTGTWTGSYSLK